MTHYYFDGARPWRPGHSEHERAYFEPTWIPATWSLPVIELPTAALPAWRRARSLAGRVRRRF